MPRPRPQRRAGAERDNGETEHDPAEGPDPVAEDPPDEGEGGSGDEQELCGVRDSTFQRGGEEQVPEVS